MTVSELTHEIRNVLQGLGPTTSKRVVTVLNSTLEFLETPPAAEPTTSAPSDLSALADQLDAAVNVRIGAMDSDSRIAQINAERVKVMQSVAARLRGA